jgi:cysteinyl-tRNA synthetase
MREIQLHDTLSGELQPLRPREQGRVGIYACGPTVYSRIHIGNARPFVVFNLLARFLEHEGYRVDLVVNVTDVNDKIYVAARAHERRPRPADDRALHGRHGCARHWASHARAAGLRDDGPDRRLHPCIDRARPRL